MKKIYCYFFGIMLTAGFSACTSENEFAEDFAEPAKTYKVSIPASFINADTRAVELSKDGNYLKAYFKEGENVRVFKNKGGWYDNMKQLLKASNSGISTTLEGEIDGKYAVGDELLLSYDNVENPYNAILAFAYQVQGGTLKSASKWDYAHAKVKVVSVDDKMGIIETEPAVFENLQSYFNLSFVDKKTKSPIMVKNVRIESNKFFPSTFIPFPEYNSYGFSGYKLFPEKPSDNIWVVMTICDNAEDEEIKFIVEDENRKVYEGTKMAHAGELTNGKFYGSTIELEYTGIQNTLEITPPENYTIFEREYRITGNVSITGQSHLYCLRVTSPDIEIKLKDVEITNDDGIFSIDRPNVTINLEGENVMNYNSSKYSGGFSLPVNDPTTFKGTGTLEIINTNINLMDYPNVIYEGNLTPTYDADNKIIKIAPLSDDAIITFADDKVKEVCVAKWDTNEDGKLSYGEAAAVTDLEQAFKDNKEAKSFKELTYFTGLTSITESAFEGSVIEDISIPSGITSIAKDAFKNNTSLNNIFALPSMLTSIGESAFEGCTALKGTGGSSEFRIPLNMVTIEKNAFKGATNLMGLYIYATNLKIGESAFEGCNLNNGVEFAYSAKEGSVEFGDAAFKGCQWMRYVRYIPKNVTFGNEVFMNSNTMRYISMYAETPPAFGTDMLSGCDALTSIQVPSASVDTYKVTAGWSDFAEKITGV